MSLGHTPLYKPTPLPLSSEHQRGHRVQIYGINFVFQNATLKKRVH